MKSKKEYAYSLDGERFTEFLEDIVDEAFRTTLSCNGKIERIVYKGIIIRPKASDFIPSTDLETISENVYDNYHEWGEGWIYSLKEVIEEFDKKIEHLADELLPKPDFFRVENCETLKIIINNLNKHRS